jgi:hypothetical protein
MVHITGSLRVANAHTLTQDSATGGPRYDEPEALPSMALPSFVFRPRTLGVDGVWLAGGRRAIEDEEREEFGVVQSATLTLLGLIVGFTFSMAPGPLRRATRKQRPMPSGRNACAPISYLPPRRQKFVRSFSTPFDQHVHFYDARDSRQLSLVNTQTAKLQAGRGAANAASRAGGIGHELRVEFAGAYLIGVVESNPDSSLQPDGVESPYAPSRSSGTAPRAPKRRPRSS